MVKWRQAERKKECRLYFENWLFKVIFGFGFESPLSFFNSKEAFLAGLANNGWPFVCVCVWLAEP